MTLNSRQRLQYADTFTMKQRLCTLIAASLLLLFPFVHAQAVFPDQAEKGEQQRQAFIQAARSYLGAPYVSGGTTKRGMDCSGLVWRAGQDGPGLALPRTVVALSGQAERIADANRQPGDLLFFNTTGRLSHVAIYLGGGSFIHAASDGNRTGVIVSSLSEDYWRRTYRFSGRIISEGLSYSDTYTPADSGTGGDSAIDRARKDSTGGTSSFGGESFPFEGSFGFRFSVTGGVVWGIMPGESPFRGGNLTGEASWMRGVDVYPGIGFGFCTDTQTGSISVPLFLSLTMKQGFRVFIGTQFHLMADDELDASPQFPGILGISWNSKPAEVLGQKFRFYQSAEYSHFPNETFSRGFRFVSGLTFVFDR